MKNEEFMTVASICLIVMIVMAMVISNDTIRLHRKEWHCVKSKIIDNQNLDKVECILYEKIQQEINNE